LLNVLIGQSNRRWISWVFLAPRFSAGTITIKFLARKLWKINRPGHHASGIVFLMTFVSALLTWPWMFQNCRHGNLRCALLTQRKYFVSEASVYRLLKSLDLITSPAFIVIKAADEFRDKTTAINQLWQTDFTYLKVIGWGWMYLSTILDDYSRYIIAWKLCTTMKTSDVTDTLNLALQASDCDQAPVVHKPRLLSDNGSSYVSGELAEWLGDKKMGHVRGAPYHPQIQGKIERWHQTLKNRILLENYFFPADLEARIEAFVDHYNHQRYHESINNLTPADVYFGRGQSILKQRERIKLKTMENRRLQYRKYAA